MRTMTQHLPFLDMILQSWQGFQQTCRVTTTQQDIKLEIKDRRQTLGQFLVHGNAESVKLPQPQLRTRTYTQTGQSTLRATQVRAALSHAYAVTYQNSITDKP
jgi:hypothetical protein